MFMVPSYVQQEPSLLVTATNDIMSQTADSNLNGSNHIDLSANESVNEGVDSVPMLVVINSEAVLPFCVDRGCIYVLLENRKKYKY